MAASAKAPFYLSWYRAFLPNGNCRKEVRYYLKRSDGLSDLAVVGTEKGTRHMSYNYAIKDVSLISASCPLSVPKLRKRREVVDWLNSIVSDMLHPQDTREACGTSKNIASGLNASNTLERSEQPFKTFTWVGSPRAVKKNRSHYISFCRNGVRISVHDFVYVLAEFDKRLVAYLDDMYEDSRGNRMVVVRWFHKIDEVDILLPNNNYNDREILFSLCLQNLSIECVDGLATVLSPQHYQSLVSLPNHTHTGPFVCHRLFDNDELKSFDITSVKGYWRQELLKHHMSFSSPKKMHSEEFSGDIVGNRPYKRLRISKDSVPRKWAFKSPQKQCNGSSLAPMEISNSNEACLDVMLHRKDTVREEHVLKFDIGSQVEIMSQDSGLRGCWFRGVVIKKHKNKVKVQYKDVKDAEDEAKNLEEWVLSTKLAAPDKFGLRINGRTLLRPSPSPRKGRVSWAFNVGVSVDAWWNAGWWEGIVVQKESENWLHIYFPGEKQTQIFSHDNLRHSQEWLIDGWKHLKENPDLIPVLCGGVQTVTGAVKESLDHVICTDIDASVRCAHHRPEKPPKVNVVFAKQGNLDGLGGASDLSKDNRLGQLQWKSFRKRRLSRSPPVNKAHFGFNKNQNVNEESNSFFSSSLKADPGNCKYMTDSLFNSSVVSPLNSLVMSQ
ncbi:unnamed protein product [Cuscuta europaea]|uniref:BAH domain-containing protein n=1 Tax=Cuscuta europaea TaxID=41803 RepID=A0A9P0ZKC6_CUSEU|nr:unnamed protein product [Cuscuta europaea]